MPNTDDKLAIQRIQAVMDGVAHIKGAGHKCPIAASDFLAMCRKYHMSCEVALAQGWDESHLGMDDGRPQRTHNIWNVGNVDSGANHQMGDWLTGMEKYCQLMVDHYGVTADVLIARKFHFVDTHGNVTTMKYASDPEYVNKFISLLHRVRTLMGTG